jgi:hypothetical protein
MAHSRFLGQPSHTNLGDRSPIIQELYIQLEITAFQILNNQGDLNSRCLHIQNWMKNKLNIHTTRIIAFQYFGVDAANKTKTFCMREISERIFEINVQNNYVDNRQLILEYAMMLVNMGRELIEQVHFENEIQNPSNKRYLSNIILSNESAEELEQVCDCPICYGDNIRKNNILTTNCGHDFCKECISICIDRTPMQNFPICPLCREEVTSLVARENAIHQDLVSKYN